MKGQVQVQVQEVVLENKSEIQTLFERAVKNGVSVVNITVNRNRSVD